MDEQNAVWQPIEPTTPVWKYPYELTAHAPNPYEDAIPIPPPPPRKPRRHLGVLLVIALLLFSAAGLFYWTYTVYLPCEYGTAYTDWVLRAGHAHGSVAYTAAYSGPKLYGNRCDG